MEYTVELSSHTQETVLISIEALAYCATNLFLGVSLPEIRVRYNLISSRRRILVL